MNSNSMARETAAKLALAIYNSEVRRHNKALAKKAQRNPDSCVVTVFANSKGGTGKSSTCHAIAAALATNTSLRARVLIIDLDMQGLADNIRCIPNHQEIGRPSAVDIWLGYALDENYYHADMQSPFPDANIYREYRDAGLTHREILKLAIQNTDIDELDVIPAHNTDSRAIADVWINYSLTKNLNCLSAFVEGVIEPLTSQYDFIFIDTVSDLNPITLAAINSASILLTPIVPQQLSLQGTQCFFNDLYKMLEHLPIRGENIKIIKSMVVNYDASSEFDKSMLEYIKRTLSDNCMTNVIHSSSAFELAARNFCSVFDVSTDQVSEYEIKKLESVKGITHEFIMLLQELG